MTATKIYEVMEASKGQTAEELRLAIKKLYLEEVAGNDFSISGIQKSGYKRIADVKEAKARNYKTVTAQRMGRQGYDLFLDNMKMVRAFIRENGHQPSKQDRIDILAKLQA